MSKDIYSNRTARVYKVTNEINNKCYIGVTIQSLNERKQQHEYEAKSGSNLYFHKSIRKHTPSAFLWETLIEISDVDQAFNVLEPYYIQKYNSFDRNCGYNMTLGGEGICTQHIPSKETLQNLYQIDKKSTTKIGKIFNVSHRTVSSWLNIYNLRKAVIPIPDEKTLRHLYFKEGKTIIEIGHMFNRANCSVFAWFKKYGIEMDRNRQRRLEIPKKEILQNLYWTEERSISEMAKIFETTGKTVKSWFVNLNIPIRSHSDTISLSVKQKKIPLDNSTDHGYNKL